MLCLSRLIGYYQGPDQFEDLTKHRHRKSLRIVDDHVGIPGQAAAYATMRGKSRKARQTFHSSSSLTSPPSCSVVSTTPVSIDQGDRSHFNQDLRREAQSRYHLTDGSEDRCEESKRSSHDPRKGISTAAERFGVSARFWQMHASYPGSHGPGQIVDVLCC
jgi:hypothetical protein